MDLDAAKLLQKAQESQEVSDSLSGHFRGSRQARTAIPQLTQEVPAWGPGDLRPQLEAFHRHTNR